MATWLKRPEIRETTEYCREFHWRDSPTSGFSFSVDSEGHPLDLHPCALDNYLKCTEGKIDVVDDGVIERQHTHREPGEIECVDCGQPVTMWPAFTITCDCGADYNSAGQRLAPREHWGEETGEHWSDCY